MIHTTVINRALEADQTKNMMGNESAGKYLDGLVCPDCRTVLGRTGDELACSHCHANYPIEDGIPSFVKLDPNALPFKEEYFNFWFERENTHFWHISRREIIRRFLEPFLRKKFPKQDTVEAIEIGIGNGNVSKELLKLGVPMTGADLFLSSLKFCRKRMQIPLYQVDVLKLPFEERFDLIGIYDILEHIEDDALAIRNLYRALKPGGLLNVTVPALRSLWSPFDELDHKRRYEKRELVEKLTAEGFKVRRTSFFMCLLFPVVFVVRKLQRYSKDEKLENVKEVRVIPGINGLLLFIFRIEKLLLKFLDLPIGSSLIVVAEKPSTAPAGK